MMNETNELWRMQTYALLATLLARAPQQSLLDQLASLEVTEPDSEIGEAWQQLINAASELDETTVADEYHALFIGITEGEVIPYGSYYQTGFLHEKPLIELRRDLAALGLERKQETAEPEDHIAAECDVMRLILSAQGTPIVDEKAFFLRHLQPWAASFFSDLKQAESARFYNAVAQLGLHFFEQELTLIK